MTALLIQQLQNPKLYSHPIKYFRVIETHISYVILTGEYAYKIKKPLNMDFLDFSTLDKRHYYCQEELRLNKHFASNIYLAVLPICGTPEQPNWAGIGPIIEYAIQMHEFPQKNLFSHLVSKNSVKSEDFIALAQRLADIHQQALVAAHESRFGMPEQLFFPVQQNFDQIRPLLIENHALQQLQKIEQWAQYAYQQLQSIFLERKAQGFIRECHGDLHLGNIVKYHDEPTIFDSIEFNLDLRWTDVMADIGFLVMDLQEKNRSDLATIFLNHYLTLTGDYGGLRVLLFYQSYRAVVRAKISLFQLQQNQDAIERKKLQDGYNRSMAVAEQYLTTAQPQLIIMHGIAGSGKTTIATKVAHHVHAIHLRSDVERKRLFIDSDYSAAAIQKVYDHLAKITEMLLANGYSVIVDATFLLKTHRDIFQVLANNYHALFYIVPCHVDEKTSRIRLEQRREQGQDYSEADISVAQLQRQQLEPLTSQELQQVKKYQL